MGSDFFGITIKNILNIALVLDLYEKMDGNACPIVFVLSDPLVAIATAPVSNDENTD